MDYKISYHLLKYGGLISIILIFIATQLEESTTLRIILAVIGFISLALNIVQSLAFYRCPGCGHPLSTRVDLPKYCPECGKKLD